VLVDERDFAAAERRTRALLADPAVPAIFEAALAHGGVRVRADVLERLDGGALGLREVKATAGVKETHLDDVAVQRWVVEGAGPRVASVEVIHLDTTYVRGEGGIDWPRLFARADVTAACATRLAAVPERVAEMHAVLACGEAPAVEPSSHCWRPHGCEFWGHCTRDKPEDWIHHLPRLRGARAEDLRAAGVERIAAIPEDFPLGALQARVREAVRSGREVVTPGLGAALAGLGPPACYLDFEAMSPPIPLYAGTRPFERIPFQWSLHRIGAAGGVSHRAFLADGRADPRRPLAEALLAALAGTAEPILAYSSFEATVLAELARALPDLAPALDALRARVRDLWPVVRAHVYHPGFRCSFSLKDVAPALAPGLGYGDLDGVADGQRAAYELARIAAGACAPDEEERVRRALLAYCERDTRALLEVHRALRQRAGG
jgi:hypothetical protein